MNQNFQIALENVLFHEGGYIDHPDDPGGATNKGITLSTFRRLHPNGTKDDLKKIDNKDVAKIYRYWYWDQCKCDDIPAGLDYCVFDAAVNSGPFRALRWLDRCGNVHPRVAIVIYCKYRMEFLKRLENWLAFGRGWSKRVERVETKALRMENQYVHETEGNGQ